MGNEQTEHTRGNTLLCSLVWASEARPGYWLATISSITRRVLQAGGGLLIQLMRGHWLCT